MKLHKIARRYWTYGHNVEGALRNGSFIRSMPGRRGGFARYMNGDFIDILDAVPAGGREDYTEISEDQALRLIPAVCGGRG